MIEKDDIRAAVAAGILSEAQAASMTALAHSRSGARERLDPGDEPFELFRGFNEIFIVVGLIILAFGWMIVSSFVSLTRGSMTSGIVLGICAAVVLWLLSEYFVQRRRMVAPAITLSIFFAANALFTFSMQFAEVFMIAQSDFSSLPIPLTLATLALLGFWYRFRVPFALAIVALCAFVVSILIAADRTGAPTTLQDLFLLSADGPFAFVTLAVGAIVFLCAMAFDMSDPYRVTRRSANGFWLHVVAAPALVNTIALSLLANGSLFANALLLGFLTLIAVVAVIIDRRSFLIAAIVYVVLLIQGLLRDIDGSSGILSYGGLILALGICLLSLGANWERIRAALMRALPRSFPRHRLPPTV